MKTYLLREAKTVEPQSNRRKPRTGAATVSEVVGRPPTRGPALFIGLDVHTQSIAVSIAPSDSTEVRRYGEIGGTHDDVLKLAKKLAATHPGRELRFCYEAGPHGYPLCRCLRAHGYARRQRSSDGSDGAAVETRTGKVPPAKEFSGASVWDDQALDGLHALRDERTGESPDRMESDHTGLQPQTRAEPGERPETHRRGGLKSRGARPCAEKGREFGADSQHRCCRNESTGKRLRPILKKTSRRKPFRDRKSVV